MAQHNTASGQTETAKTYAEVALNVPLGTTFHYLVPPHLIPRLCAGARVAVPFGPRRLTGYCVALTHACPLEDARLRQILEIMDESPLLDARMLDLTRWLATEYHCSWGAALEAALPAGVRAGTAARTVTLIQAARSSAELKEKAESLEARAPRQAAVLRVLAEEGGELTLAETGGDSSVAKALTEQGWITCRKEPLPVDALAGLRAAHASPHIPTPAQTAALEIVAQRLTADPPGVVLLHGVTSSGKTEVYLQTLRRVVDSGRQGIVLVPEISLTPQTVRRFAARFERVAVLHSRLSEAERREQWRLIKAGEIDVVVGTRAAIFAPLTRLGLIVVDEEHEPSFKHLATPRYHAVSVARRRGESEKALVILGSATPSLESYHHALTGDYTYVRLPTRIADAPMPHVDIVNMTVERAEQKKYCLLSRRLVAEMKQSLSRDEQVILFLNRRGFSTFITCPRCKEVLRCSRCAVSLAYHEKSNVVKCHYCGKETKAPDTCPACGHDKLVGLGVGTQKIEDEVKKLFKEHPVARMDTDSTRGPTTHADILDDFREGKTRILLGTQMIAKGLDFPNVTLVGVINADVALNISDFRSAERTFQLIMQVAGRTGRGRKGGKVIVQTSSPDQDCIRFAVRHDYVAYAEREMASRKELGYPPSGRLTRVLVEGKVADKCRAKCEEIAEMLKTLSANCNIQILGPAEAPIAKARGMFRFHLLIKEQTPGHMHAALLACRSALRSSGGTRVTVDVDPVNLQ